MQIDNDTVQSATIAIRAILEAWVNQEPLYLETIHDYVLEDAKKAYKVLMLSQGLQPEKAYQ